MKFLSRSISVASLLLSFLGLTRVAEAQSIWNGTNTVSATTNWSLSANWLPTTVPGAGANVKFYNNGGAGAIGTINNVVDSSLTIGSLQYANTNGFHTTRIEAGQTLTVAGGLTVGTGADSGAALAITTVVSGPGTLAVNNTSSNLFVNQASASAGAHLATLILTNLDTFTATSARLLVGFASGVNRAEGVLHLAKTNTLTFSGGAPQIYLGFNNGNNNGNNNFPILYLGQTNAIFADSMTISGDKQTSTLLAFTPVFTNANPAAYLRGANGTGRVSTWNIADNSGQSTTASGSSGTIDFSDGTVNALVDTIRVGISEKNPATGAGGIGTLTFNKGTIDVNTLFVGFQFFAGGSSTGNGRVNVNGTASLVVNNAICLANSVSPNTASVGSLVVNGGSVTANSITNGGGGTSSLILSNNATLSISTLLGVIGTTAVPLQLMTVADSTLQLQVSGLATNIVANAFELGGTTNVVNITALPGLITTYPAQFPIVSFPLLYTPFNLGLGTLPAGGYAGYLSNNLFTATIDLVLTAGPTNAALLQWSGAASGNWDTTSVNWLNTGVPTVFQNNLLAQFDDTATGSTNVNLTATLLPASLTVSNNTLQYAFTGSGKLSGTTGLRKDGSGTLTIANSGVNDFLGAVTIANGALQIGNGGTTGNLPAGSAVTNNSSLIYNRTNTATVPNAIAGTGTLTQNGAGTLTLSGSNSYTGATFVNAGTLLINGIISSAVSNAPGTTLGGTGTNFGTVSAAGSLQPGGANAGTLSVGALTLNSGATTRFDLTGSDSQIGGGVNDLVNVDGNLALNNNSITANVLGVPQAGIPYRLINYTGSKTGSFNSVVGGTHFTATLDQTTANQINLTLSGTGANLKWNSTSSGVWDNGATTNWLNLGGSTPDVFYSGDSVLVDDSVAGVVTNITIASGVAVSPTALTVNSTNNFLISGSGQINGATSVIKQGTGTLTLSTANNLPGPVLVQAGTLIIGNNSALGGATTVVSNGATLDISGHGLASTPIIVSGAGVGGNGAIVNSGAEQQSAFLNVSLSGDTTFGAANRWDIRGTGSPAFLNSVDGQPYNLTIVGTNSVVLVSATVDQNLGNVEIRPGATFGIQVNTLVNSPGWAGSPGKTITVQSNAVLDLFNVGTSVPLGRSIALNDGTLLSVSGNSLIGGLVALQGSNTVNVLNAGGGPAITMSNVVSGNGSLTKVGASPLILTGSNTYSGNTYVREGSLTLNGDGSISHSSVITVAGTLNASGRSDLTLTLASGQTLTGTGTVGGHFVVGPGATVSVGNTIGTLTVSNGSLTLAGTTQVKIDKANATNDVIRSDVSAAFGGVLNVTILNPVANGDGFKLFDAPLYSGTFSSIVPPTPGAGLAWDTNSLAFNGTLAVVTGAAPPTLPVISGIVQSGTNLIISGTNGTAGGNYYVLASTNLALPLSNWSRLATNTFGGAGQFQFTNTINPGSSRLFYSLQLP